MVFNGRAYDEITAGETFADALTVTETHIVLAAGMFGDFNPLHVNQAFGENSRFGGRILHGPFTSALISAPVGVFFAGTAVAYLEHACRFKLPVRAGDTLTTTWTITEKIDKPKIDGGIAVMTAVCRNQQNELVAEADGKIMLKNRLAAQPAA
jgi:3-hydroxybutyryl-CoA dehydratase